MGNKSRSVKGLRTEILNIGKEIDKRINRLDRLPDQIERDYEHVKNVLLNEQAAAEIKFRKSLIATGGEAWDYAWDHVFAAVKALNPPINNDIYNYQHLEPALRTKQIKHKKRVNLAQMWPDQAWNEVWNVVWKIVGRIHDDYLRHFTKEIDKIGTEMESLLEQKKALQAELDRLSGSSSGAYNVLKKLTNTVVKPSEIEGQK